MKFDALVLEKDPAATRGTEGYLTHLQHCITTVIEGLTEEETMEFEDLADQWNAKGVDPDIQARWVQPSSFYFIHVLNWRRQADKHMVKFAKDFMETAYKQMGVHVFMLLGWENSEGALVRTKYACNLSVLFFRYLICCQGGNGHTPTSQGAVHRHIQYIWQRGMG